MAVAVVACWWWEMSILAMNWVWTLEDLGPSETLVLLALADAADDDGFCWPSQTFLARKSRQTDRNVRRILNRLEGMGLLRIEARSSTHGRRSNLYYLNVGFSLESRQPDTDVLPQPDTDVRLHIRTTKPNQTRPVPHRQPAAATRGGPVRSGRSGPAGPPVGPWPLARLAPVLVLRGGLAGRS